MNKSILILLLIVSALLTTNLNAQELKNTEAFYKTTTNILTAINSFDEVNNGNLGKEIGVTQIEKNLSVINTDYEFLKKDLPNDEDFNEYELWVLTIRKSLEMLKENDSTYAFGCSLIKMNIFDFMNSKY